MRTRYAIMNSMRATVTLPLSKLVDVVCDACARLSFSWKHSFWCLDEKMQSCRATVAAFHGFAFSPTNNHSIPDFRLHCHIFIEFCAICARSLCLMTQKLDIIFGESAYKGIAYVSIYQINISKPSYFRAEFQCSFFNYDWNHNST